MMTAGRLALAAGGSILVFLVAAGLGCGSGNDSGVGNAKVPEGSRSEGVEHEACTESGNRVEALDANGDGKPDIKRVYDKSNHEVCRITDLNHDGKPDMFEYYDASGSLRRREADFDDSGVVDMIEYFEGGKLVRKELDTTGQHRVDTWDYFDPASGKRLKRERDTTNDGRVDQWWTFDGDNVTIAMDKSGDGKPEPENTIVIGPGADKDKDKDGGATASNTNIPDAALNIAPPQPESASTGDGGALGSLAHGPTPTTTTPDAGPPKRKESRGGPKK